MRIGMLYSNIEISVTFTMTAMKHTERDVIAKKYCHEKYNLRATCVETKNEK